MRVLTVLVTLLVVCTPSARADIALSSPKIDAERGLAMSLTATVSVPALGHDVGTVEIDATATAPANVSWLSIAGATGPVTPPVDVPFTITVTVPAGAAGRQYAFSLGARADGADIGNATLVVEVGAGLLNPAVSQPSFVARWKESRLIGGLRVRGASPAAGRLTIQISPKGGKLLRRQVYQIAPGSFSRLVNLPGSVPPGRYTVSAALALNPAPPIGPASFARSWTVDLAPPPEGYVDKAWISGLPQGPAALSFATGTRVLYASFHFAYRPRTGAVTTTWYQPDGTPTRAVAKPRAQLVQGSVQSTPLASGRWRCVVRVDGVAVGETSVRIS
jgi:hypothetical protein